MLPQVNAILISINTDGATEDWAAGPGAPGPAIWSGSSDAYVMEKIRTVYSQSAGGLLKEKEVTIIISSNLTDINGNTLTVNTGHIFTYSYRGTMYTRRVMDYSAPYLPGIGLQEYIRVNLNPAAMELALEAE